MFHCASKSWLTESVAAEKNTAVFFQVEEDIDDNMEEVRAPVPCTSSYNVGKGSKRKKVDKDE